MQCRHKKQRKLESQKEIRLTGSNLSDSFFIQSNDKRKGWKEWIASWGRSKLTGNERYRTAFHSAHDSGVTCM